MAANPLPLWKRCLILGVLTVVGLFVGMGSMLLLTSPAPFEVETPDASTQFISPHAKLSPEEVVRLQMAALRAYRTDDAALLQCFALASPANRAVTGPLEDFSQMVQGPRYRAMIHGKKSVVGTPVFHGRQAMILVSVIDDERNLLLYRFYLSRQNAEPYVDCWMTDAVTFEGMATPPAATPPKVDA
jgi:hypothetical protein